MMRARPVPQRGSSPRARRPRQARSRATLDRFLAAAAELLAERCFEEATVAELVRRARSSVGAFYARFESKEALLHELDERVLEAGRASWAEFLDPVRWKGKPASALVEGLVARLVDGRRKRRGLLRALALYARARPDSAFARRGAELNRLLTRHLTERLLERRREIGHPDPARAVAFALELADSVTRDAIVFEDTGFAPARLTDRELKSELAGALRLYLRLEE
jgi:AcrR family transcriptional regulator